MDENMRPRPNAGFSNWVGGYRSRALSAGVSGATFDRAFASAGYIPGVIEKDRNQAEFTKSLGDYLSTAASDTRVETGRAMLSQYSSLLSEIEARYGVDRQTVLAVWGMESNFGKRRGEIPVISALATLAYEGRRGRFFEQQLTSALKILQNGDVTPENMKGSWAGAMGHTQFIPTSYEAYAADFRGDGRRDIWSDDPTDGLASTAKYLSNFGWRKGQPGVSRWYCPRASTTASRAAPRKARPNGRRSACAPRPAARSATSAPPRSSCRKARRAWPS
ncbi:membrane-bound lytic murein transglycosylase B precursor [Limimaricola cinnabarinus LL-001]|uniref:Membrane-bound lytic murein transglycosylase B n=1 Tax=Limimaricola cinnabarinus LL-001 TaxID=1337093 RepID=U2YZ03_9RHOB|nr:membrane-bound lytic murein transglycosylase B precursor [Limimaricola cinnabarinus LL-001]